MVNVLLELQRPVNWLVITVKVNILLELLLPVIDYYNYSYYMYSNSECNVRITSPCKLNTVYMYM